MRNGFQYILAIIFTFTKCLCIGPDWNNHPIMQQAVEERVDRYTSAFLNVSYVDPATGERVSERTNVGKFGDSHESPAAGVLVHVRSDIPSDDPFTGCGFPLKSSYGALPTADEPWIALVKKGRCSPQIKMQNAYNSNATGILIYNDKDNNSLDRMQLQLNIPREFSAVFTYKWKGEELAKLIDNGTKVMIQISVAEICPRTPTNLNKTSVLFVSVSFIVLMIVSLGWIIFYYVQKCRYIHAKERLSKRLCSAAKKALQKIPIRYVRSDEKDGGNLGDTDCCAICIEIFKPADVLRLLPCRHEFHKLCIDPWLLENRTCPMCKMDILKYFGFELTGSQESMLRIEQEDPFSEIFFFEPDTLHVSTIVETAAIMPVTVNHITTENRPTTSADCTGTVSQAIIDTGAERNTVSIYGKSQNSFNMNNENRLPPIKRSFSLDNVPSISQP